MPNDVAYDRAQEAARRQARHVYINDPRQLSELRAGLRKDVAALIEAEQFDDKIKGVWSQFLPQPAVDEELTDEENTRRQEQWQRAYIRFHFALSEKGRLKFDTAVGIVLNV